MANNEINPNEIQNHITTLKKIDIISFTTLDSTNTYAKNHSDEFSNSHPTLIIADQQTAGYGRFKRGFFSPKDTGIYLSLVLPINNIDDPSLLTLATGVAVVSALREMTNSQLINLKWVNDILIHDKKCGGILTESISDSHGKISKVIVGIGLNINTLEFPEELENIATSISDEIDLERNTIVSQIIKNFFKLDLTGNDFLSDYRTYCSTLGKTIQVVNGNQTIAGKAIEIADDGSLVLIDDKKNRHRINSGEVTKIYLN
ncbi:biotin--[acetyl-CoA-carboxylase] ligase [Companilactobacillus sp.]|uniref:biotin--[acetyl-CoA-carboxylase] ligase n=1 Tax=Companilactobacillus sp. TaxID=2767905 RepID=UPI002633FDF5|nr:biotin--[acetyl-CoA-carboxylase] ligase [Companilactobacillus sp.]